ncbi:MAG: hypothetical protein ACOC2D_11505 [Spirochaetota bacterium]
MSTSPGRSAGQDRARELVRDINRALRRESWGRNIIQLAWTAGPVTYLALQGGYLLGYGQPAPPALFIYFGAYTIIAGVVAILARLIYQITRGRDVERGTRILRDCLDQLPRLLLAARDAALASYSEGDARLLAAQHLLANPDATELAVAAAIRDLGGSRDLAYAFQRIEVFRRNGMPSRVEAERSRIEAEVDRLCGELDSRSPDTAALVRRRSHGQSPSKRRGRRRTEGFIERGLAAESEDNRRLMSLTDVEEILTFAMELLAGRSLLLVTFEFAGDRKIADAWAALERTRREFRARLRSRNSRLRIAAERLSSRLDGVVPSIARIRDLSELRDDVVAAIDAWTREFDRPRLRKLPRHEVEAFRRAMNAYRYLEQANDQLHRSHRRMVEAVRRYQAIVEARTSRDETIGFAVDGGDGVRITDSEIGLDERARIGLARAIRSILEHADAWKTESIDLAAADIQGAAVEILSAIEDRLPLYRSDVQQAIELSRAPTIESLEPGLSADVRAGWAAALIDEVEENHAEYALRRVAQLVRFHGLRLGDRARGRIADQFGIDRDALQALDRSAQRAESPWSRTPLQIPQRSPQMRRMLDKVSK